MRILYLLFIFLLETPNAAFDLKPLNQSGPGAGMWLSFRSPYPSPSCDPSALYALKNPCVFTSRWHPWKVRDITVNNLWTSFPAGITVTGLGYFQVRHKMYKETKIWAAISRRMTGSLVAGVAFSTNRLAIENYGNAAAITTTVSIHQKVNAFHWGLVLDNPFRASIGKTKEPLPYGSVISSGTGNKKMWVQGEWKIGNYLSSGPAVNMAFLPVKGFAISVTALINHQLINVSMELDLESIFVSYGLHHSAAMQNVTHTIGLGFRAGSRPSR